MPVAATMSNDQKRPRLSTAFAALTLAACGGSSEVPAPAPPAPPTPPMLEISGVAATGKAIANAAVRARCATGAGTATTQANGSYVIDISGGSLPCVLEVTAAGAALHSAAEGSGAGSVKVNITPLTELVLGKAVGGVPSVLFANFDAAAQTKVSAAALEAAITSVARALQGTVDLNGVNPIKDTLIAAEGSTPGNPLDGKLDTLQAVLSSARTSLTELTAVIANANATPVSVQQLLQPAAASCVGLRTGRYAWVSPVQNDPTAPGFTLVDVDAATLRLSYQSGGATQSLDLADDGACAYSIPDDGQSSSKVLVSKSGIAVVRDTDSSGPQAGITFVSGMVVPLQATSVSELAGTWNLLDYYRETPTTAFAPGRGTLVVDAAGKITAYTTCDSAGMCRPESIRDDAFSTNPNGGFNVGGSATEAASRAFAYRAANGALSMILKYSQGRGVMVLTQQAALTLPAVGEISNFWDFSITSSGAASTLVESSTTVTDVNASAGTFTRLRASDQRIDSFKVNDPQPGMRSRAANTCTANGAALACTGIAVMPLPGTGISTYVSVAPDNFFGMSIAKP
jgi:hypothetical protein